MCGIVGYIGDKDASSLLIKALKTLEYRGYDSAGIAVLEDEKIRVFKEKGRVKDLEDSIQVNINSSVGIAHTRWATHGLVNKINAHPHMDNKENFAVVHNGIIENYEEIKAFLISKGYTFNSDVDSLVIPNLMDYYYEQEKDVLESFKKTVNSLKGSFAILLISPFISGLLVARFASPLVIGRGKKENYVASAIPAIIEYTEDFYIMDDKEIAVVTNDKIDFYDFDLKRLKKKIKTIKKSEVDVDKNNYDDYMLKEIFDQPHAIRDTLEGYLDFEIDFRELKKLRVFDIDKIYIVACGTAYHAGRVGKVAFQRLLDIDIVVQVASEFRYENPKIDEGTLCIFISQSGETADTIAALKLAKSKHAQTLAITNVVNSSITREAEYVIYTKAGVEVAVASTKAYVSQVAMLVVIAMAITNRVKGGEPLLYELKYDLEKLPVLIQEVLQESDNFKRIAKQMKDIRDCFYIGRGNDYNIALEGSLKLKEISYIHSEAYQAGELKHGPIALIDDNVYVIAIITDDTILDKTMSNIREVMTRGARVILVSDKEIKDDKIDIIKIPHVNNILAPILAIIPLQFMAYYIAKEKKLDVDKPRNLAKSVTVE